MQPNLDAWEQSQYIKMISHQIIRNLKLQIFQSIENCYSNSNRFKNGIFFLPLRLVFSSIYRYFANRWLLYKYYSFQCILCIAKKKYFVVHFSNICLHILTYLWLYCSWFVRYCINIISIFISFVVLFHRFGFCFDCTFNILKMMYTTHTSDEYAENAYVNISHCFRC